jgi:prepilin-type N-terminal cleavage/methylation domain-containing protein
MKKRNSPIIPFHKGDEHKAFTLVEILVSMTIFAIIMVSVMMIYVTATDISKKYDINREMRNNIKSVVEDIAEEVRKNDIV